MQRQDELALAETQSYETTQTLDAILSLEDDIVDEKLKSRSIVIVRQCSDSDLSVNSDEETLLPSWKAPATIVISCFYVLFILNPFSFAADDFFASFNDGIMRYFQVDDKEAQRLSYHWDSISNAVATIGAPVSAVLCSVINPAYISVFGSCLACTGIALVMQGFNSSSPSTLMGGIGIRSIGSELQFQALFPVIKAWTDSLHLRSAEASSMYMERAVSMVNASILLTVALGPILAISHSLKVITIGFSIAFGLCGLSTMILTFLLCRKETPASSITEHKRAIESSVRTSVWSKSKRFARRTIAQAKAFLQHILTHPRALLTLFERNIILALQEQTGKGFSTVILPMTTTNLDKDNLGRLILIIPALCMAIVTILYTFATHHNAPLDRFVKRWNSLSLCVCMLFTCTCWHFLARENDNSVAIVLIVLLGLGRGLASCLISHPVGAAYDAKAELINPSNFMPLISNILQNCIFSFTAWFMLHITAHQSPEQQVSIYRSAPFWGYIGTAGLFLLQGVMPMRKNQATELTPAMAEKLVFKQSILVPTVLP